MAFAVEKIRIDDASVGVDGLVDAMTMFGAERVAPGAVSGVDGIRLSALEQLAIRHESARTSGFRSEFQAVND